MVITDSNTIRAIVQSYSARDHIMDIAQSLAQTHGINAFSYRDIADKVGVKSASIHHHFPKKEDLTDALMERYNNQFEIQLKKLNETIKSPKERISKYINMCVGCVDDGLKVCLCGMFAADFITLSKATQVKVQHFIHYNESWLKKNFEEAKKKGELSFTVSTANAAKILFGSLEGVIITAHAFPEENRLSGISNQLLKMFT